MARPSGEEKARNMVSSTGYCYSDVSSSNPDIQTHHLVNQLHNFDSNPEIYNLTAGIEMIGFAPKNLQQHCFDTNSAMWKGILGKASGASSSKAINESTAEFYNQHEFNTKPDFTAGGVSDATSENLMVAQDTMAWHENRLLVGDPSLRCVFPCEGNERPSQGLSLSLSSSNPSSIGLQSFELRQRDDMRFAPSSSRDGYYGKSIGIQQQQQIMQDGFLGKADASIHYQGHLQIRSSKYLAPAQELLKEFCNLGNKQSDHLLKTKFQKTNQWEDENASSSSKKQSLCSLELLELKKRKAKLLQMLEELDRRYKHYCDQMKGVVSSFEAVAGNGTATVYSALASQAMSRHFRCLRDAIVDQIKAAKKAMGEKDTVAPGTTRGDTPRLRILDQTLRQQRAFQQMSMMESHPWRPQRGLPERSVSVLRAWLFEHFLHPYPSDVDKHLLARQTGLSRSQVSNWFINARVRLWKPMVEEMYMEETKEQDKMCSSDGVQLDDSGTASTGGRQNQNSQGRAEDQKPTPDQLLVRIDSECLSSIINNQERNENKSLSKSLQDHDQPHHMPQHSFGRGIESFRAVELDFSSYNHHTSGAVSYANENVHQGFNGGGAGNGGGGVSLTLGLQQHGGTSGVSLAFSPASQGSLFYPRDHMDDCQPVHYSVLDGEGQSLPYRNLMGAQLLHDYAG